MASFCTEKMQLWNTAKTETKKEINDIGTERDTA